MDYEDSKDSDGGMDYADSEDSEDSDGGDYHKCIQKLNISSSWSDGGIQSTYVHYCPMF